MPTECSERSMTSSVWRMERPPSTSPGRTGTGPAGRRLALSEPTVPGAAGTRLPKENAVTNASTNETEGTKLTRVTYDRLVAELEDLTTRGRVEIAEQIESARALGDLSENGDYHAAKDFQGKMESRIRQLQ